MEQRVLSSEASREGEEKKEMSRERGVSSQH